MINKITPTLRNAFRFPHKINAYLFRIMNSDKQFKVCAFFMLTQGHKVEIQ
jgi:hypothetical protein